MVPIAAGVVAPRSPGGRPASWAATGRSGGVSGPPYDSLNLAGHVGDDPAAVAENLARVGALLGPGLPVAVMDAVHGADIAEVTGPGLVPAVDGLVTDAPGLALVALGADCVPMALVGDDDRTVAVAHCGWRGLVGDVVGAMLDVLERRGCGVQQVVLGPSVCGACYPVPPERAATIVERCGAAVASAALVRCPDGQPGIDVAAGVVARLQERGLAADAVVQAGGCTVEDPALFSHRRDGVTGRQGIVIARMGP